MERLERKQRDAKAFYDLTAHGSALTSHGSPQLLTSKRQQRIHPRRPPRGDVTRDQGDRCEEQ